MMNIMMVIIIMPMRIIKIIVEMCVMIYEVNIYSKFIGVDSSASVNQAKYEIHDAKQKKN